MRGIDELQDGEGGVVSDAETCSMESGVASWSLRVPFCKGREEGSESRGGILESDQEGAGLTLRSCVLFRRLFLDSKREEGELTRRYEFALSQFDFPPLFPQLITCSACFCASFALATVVMIDSCWRRDETRFRSIKSRWAVGLERDLLAS